MRKWMIMIGLALFALASVNVLYAADYAGTKKCKMCHMKQFRSWEKTKMAKTFEKLKSGVEAEAKTAAGLDPDKDYTADSSCLGCHTVNGMAETAGVGCEACHGPGSGYIKVMMTNRDYKKAELVAKGLVEPKESCAKCHNEKSPFFKGFTFSKDKGVHEHFPLTKQH